MGDLNDHFNITAATDRPAEIRLIRPLDREVPRQASVSLTVTAYDCTQTASSGCDKQTVSASSSSFFNCINNREFVERFQIRVTIELKKSTERIKYTRINGVILDQ